MGLFVIDMFKVTLSIPVSGQIKNLPGGYDN